MTTTDKTEVIAKALADLEALRQLDICDPFELTRPFRQFAAQLNTIGETLSSVGFAATIDADVRRRVENVLEEMSFAARLVETAAMSTVCDSRSLASAGVRSWFDAVLGLPHIYAQFDAEMSELRDAIKRGDISVPRTNGCASD